MVLDPKCAQIYQEFVANKNWKIWILFQNDLGAREFYQDFVAKQKLADLDSFSKSLRRMKILPRICSKAKTDRFGYFIKII